jgi:diguanylate cyclase (GGDEF)-like protein
MTGRSFSAEDALEALLEALEEAVIVFDPALLCCAVGRRVGEVFGVDGDSLLGLPRAEVLRRVSAACERPDPVLALGDARPPGIARTVEIAGPKGRVIAWTSAAVDPSSKQIGRIDVIRDVTAERRAEHELREMAIRLEEVSTIDALTGLPSRRRFEEESDREHRRAQRAWDSYAVARIDVDHMSDVNAVHGRSLGDQLLRRLGEVLRTARREYDLVARWDGDEFIVLLPGADSAAVRIVVARALDRMLRRAAKLTGKDGITLCAGAAVWIPPSDEVAEDIIRRAGNALDVARSRGLGSIEVDVAGGHWKSETNEGG